MGDLSAVGAYPGTTYTPQTPEQNGVYHEDREVTLLSGGPGSQMYRVYNAFFQANSQTWAPKNTLLPAYATVQNPDGSIHYYKLNTATGLWDGSGNNTVYNAADFGLSTTDSDGSHNQGAIAAAVTAILSSGVGGTIFIPAGVYKFKGTVSISLTGSQAGTDPGIIIAGVGAGGSELVQQANGDMFDFTGCSSNNGIRFRDLTLAYSITGSNLTGTAITATHSNHVTCERVNFIDCPQSIAIGNQCDQCGLIDCLIDYEIGASNTTMVSLAGTQDFVRGCVIRQKPISQIDPAKITGATGIYIGSVSTSYVVNSHISDFWTGIQIGHGGVGAFFSNVRVDAYNQAVLFQPETGTPQEIFGVFFSDCTFALVASSAQQTSGVLVDSNGAAASNVASIFFNNCAAYGWANAGIEISGAQNVVITGGQYSTNGQNPASTILGAGIVITNSAANSNIRPSLVTITGADCSGVYELLGSTGRTQPCGIAVSGGASDITVDSCNLKNNATNGVFIDGNVVTFTQHVFLRDCHIEGYSAYNIAINVTGVIQDIQVTSCSGYNDQGVLVTNTAPSSAFNFNGAFYGYYGPVLFSVLGNVNAPVTQIALQAHNMQVVTGAFTLPPGLTPFATITYSGGPTFKPAFAMIGQ